MSARPCSRSSALSGTSSSAGRSRSSSAASASSPAACSAWKRPLESSSQARPKPSAPGAIAASSVSRRSSSSASSVTVPGVTTRTTWRSTGPFDLAGIADLLADRDRLALAHGAREVVVERLHRHARHRDRLAAGRAARGQRDVEQARRLARVVEEQLVEVPHPIEQQHVRVLRLDAQVLGHDGGVGRGFGLFCHAAGF